MAAYFSFTLDHFFENDFNVFTHFLLFQCKPNKVHPYYLSPLDDILEPLYVLEPLNNLKPLHDYNSPYNFNSLHDFTFSSAHNQFALYPHLDPKSHEIDADNHAHSLNHQRPMAHKH